MISVGAYDYVRKMSEPEFIKLIEQYEPHCATMVKFSLARYTTILNLDPIYCTIDLNFIDCFAYLLNQRQWDVDVDLCERAVFSGKRQFVRTLLDRGYVPTTDLVDIAVGTRDINMVECLLANGCTGTPKSCETAVRLNQPNILAKLIRTGCSIGNSASIAAKYNHLNCLKAMIMMKVRIPDQAFTVSICYKRREFVTAIRSQRKINPATSIYTIAASLKSVPCLQALERIGYTPSVGALVAATEAGDQACINHITSLM